MTYLSACTLIRARGVIPLLCSEFMGDGEYRPDDQEIAGALWTAQSQLQLAKELLELLAEARAERERLR